MVWKPKPTKTKPMTVITGLICQNCIVFASDSRSTEGSVIRDDYPKLHSIESMIGEILVGQSGSVEYGNACIDEARGILKSKTIKVPRDVSEAFDTAVQKIRAKLSRNHKGSRLRMEQAVRDFNVGLMFAFYFNNAPQIWRISMEVGAANKSHNHYSTLGSGADLAEFLMSQYTSPKMEINLGIVISVLSVERVKNHVAGCGGSTQLSILSPTRLGLPVDGTSVPPAGTPFVREGHLIKYQFPAVVQMTPDFQSWVNDVAKTSIKVDNAGKVKNTQKILKKLKQEAEKSFVRVNLKHTAIATHDVDWMDEEDEE